MIYFDNSASAIPNPMALESAAEAMKHFANPSSPHFAGLEARGMVEEARKKAAAALVCSQTEIFFTSSGTEANNMAILSMADKNKRAGNVIVTSHAEHPSVTETFKALEAKGYKAVFIPVEGGELDYDFLEKTLKTEKVCLVSLMQANNQNAAITDLKGVREAITAAGSNALFHSDIVQGFLKVPESMTDYAVRYCDTASLSAHKIGGLKGIGALFVRKGLKLSPIIFGGGQETGLRSGTENVVGIAAFGTAARLFSADKSYRAKITRLREIFIEKSNDLLGEAADFKIPKSHIDALINISLKNVKSEVAMNYLSSKGICVSSSSACSSKAGENTALAAFGYGDEYNSSSLRISFSPFNTEEEVEILVRELKNALAFRIKRNKAK